MNVEARRLTDVLRRVRGRLSSSSGSVWAALDPEEVIKILDREMQSLERTGRLVDQPELVSLFAVTAEIQEIAMANGWSDEYLDLAAEFDRRLSAVLRG